jgi:hypothetical protein
MITRLTRHDHHQVKIHLTRNLSPHYAALRCVDCNVHIQWLNQSQTEQLVDLGCDVKKETTN